MYPHLETTDIIFYALFYELEANVQIRAPVGSLILACALL